MLARILGMTALALVLAAPAAGDDKTPVAPQSMEPRDTYPQADETEDRDTTEGQSEDEAGSGTAESDGTPVAPQSMEPRDTYPQAE